MEFPPPHEPAHVLARKNRQAIEDLVYALAVEAGATDPQQLCLIMQGAYVTRQVTGNENTIEIARSVAELAISAQWGDS